jgi:hypothetical protein
MVKVRHSFRDGASMPLIARFCRVEDVAVIGSGTRPNALCASCSCDGSSAEQP